ncbi:TPA: hypothetical protein ACQ9T4_002858 [Yersinia enterocolitica]|nr:hypothetical protein [Yersinia enterocolitica]
MKSAILIPTYINHFKLNVGFIKSVVDFNEFNGIPDIYFATSSENEKHELSSLLSNEFPELSNKLTVIDLESLTDKFSEYLKNGEYDVDSTSFYKDGRYSLINLKKIAGVSEVMSRGFEYVVVLDSEVIQYKKSDLKMVIDDLAARNEYRFSFAAYQHQLITKIQHDSIRSITDSYNCKDFFSRSYGWFDNICVYKKEVFIKFIEHMSSGASESEDKFLYIANKFRGLSFEWISYKAFSLFFLKEEVAKINLDDIVLFATGKNPWPTPQTENIYQYITGDEENDAKLISLINPPWVPYTENTYTIGLLNKYLPDSCCLMFHLDRKHPGAEEEKEEVAIEEVIAIEEVSVPVQLGTIGRIKRVIKRVLLG